MTRMVVNKVRWSVLAVLGFPLLTPAAELLENWSCEGVCGTGGAEGVIVSPPSGAESFAWVSTARSAVWGVGLPGSPGTNGTRMRSDLIPMTQGQELVFHFNYATTDGGGFTDYAWARLLDSTGNPVAMLFNSRTSTAGFNIPGDGLPPLDATVDLEGMVFQQFSPVWSALGNDSGRCFTRGCGYTGWIPVRYAVPETGSYVLEFGVVNWSDLRFQSALAIDSSVLHGADDPGDADYHSIELTAYINAQDWSLVADSLSLAPSTLAMSSPGELMIEWSLPTWVRDQPLELDFALNAAALEMGTTIPVLNRLQLVYRDRDGVIHQRELGPLHAEVLNSALTLEIAADQNRLEAGETVMLQVGLANLGENTGLADLTVDVLDASGNLVERLVTQSQVPVGAREERRFAPLQWVTSGAYAGNYQAYARLYDHNTGQTLDKAVNIALDVPEGMGLVARIRSEHATYAPNAWVNLEMWVENPALTRMVSAHQLELLVHNPDGEVFWSDVLPLAHIPAGGFNSVSAGFRLGDQNPGRYQISVIVRDPSGNVAANANAEFTVRAIQETGTGLSGQLFATPLPVLTGEAVTLSATVEFAGSIALESVPIELVLIDPTSVGTGSVAEIMRWSWVADFGPGSSRQFEVTAAVPADAAGHWLAILSSPLRESEPVLAQTTVALKERFSATASISGPGRVLVLVDPPLAQDCVGVQRLDLEFIPAQGLPANADVTVDLLDQEGALLDRETALIGYEGAIDQQIGPRLNLQLDSVYSHSLRARLEATDTSLLPETPIQLRVLAMASGTTAIYESPLLIPGCGLDSEAWGQGSEFVVREIDWLATGASGAQRRWLEQVLEHGGWPFRLVSDGQAFTEAMRSGGYGSYLLLSAQVKLADAMIRELREAVFTGRGIVLAGAHDHRNHLLFELFGVQPVGIHAQATGIMALPDAGPLNLDTSFAIPEKPLALRSNSAWPVAEYRLSGGRSQDRTAVAQRLYGQGLAVFAGFDLLAQGLAQGLNGPFTEFLQAALVAVQPSWEPLRPGMAVPITWRLTNAGHLASVQHDIELLDGSVAHPGPAQLLDAAGLRYRLNLGAQATQDWRFWWLLPADREEVALVSWLDRLDGHQQTQYARSTQRFAVTALPNWESLRQSLYQASSAQSHWSTALLPFERGATAASEQRWSEARSALLELANWMAEEGSPLAAQIRTEVGWLLFGLGMLD